MLCVAESMEDETTVAPGDGAEVPQNSIHIKISSCENVKTSYAVADLTIKIEYLKQVLGETEKIHVTKKERVPVDFEVILPCDFSSPVDLDKYISNPIVITVSETPREVDMQSVDILSAEGEKGRSAPEKTESKISAVDSKSSKKKGKKSSKSSTKEKSSKGSKTSKDSKAKLKKKDKKTKELQNENDPIPEAQNPRVMGVAQLDLIPIFLGKTDFVESLRLQQALTCFDDTAIAVKNLPRVEVSVSVEGYLFDGETASVLSVSLESIYNIPNLTGPECKFRICMMMPNSDSTSEPVVFKDGKYKVEENADNFKFWPSESAGTLSCRTKYMINEDLSNVKNKIDVDLERAVCSGRPRIEWNVLRRIFLTSEKQEYFYRQIKKYRKIPFEIYITPYKEPVQSEIDLKSNVSSKGSKKKKEKASKGKSSSTTAKSKKDSVTRTDTNDSPKEYLHLMGFADIGGLLYPGVTNCRVACSLNTYHEDEVMESAGQGDSYFRPRPPPVVEDKVQLPSLKKSKGKSKDEKGKKGSKTSKSSKSKSSGSSGKGKKGKKESREIIPVDLAQYLPPPSPPRPEPSKKLYSDDGAVTFLIVEFELTKPLHRRRTLEDLSKSLDNFIRKAPDLPNRFRSTKLAEQVYNETILSIADDINVQYQKYLGDKCNCENVQTFVSHLERCSIYPAYFTSITRAITLLLHEKYFFDAEKIKTVADYQTFVSEIYTNLIKQMDDVLNESIRFNVHKTPSHFRTRTDDLLFYAKEVMELGAPKIAERYYLQRICYEETNADYWFDYAVFHLELNNVDKTFECVKEALRIEPLHKYSLLMYGLLLAGDGMLAEAETCLLTVSVSHPRWVEGWGALHIFYAEAKNEEGLDLTMEMANKYKNDPGVKRDHFGETDDLPWCTQNCNGSVYLLSAALFIKMRLFDFAEKCLACALLTNEGRCEYLLAVIAYYRREFSHALEHLFRAKRLIGPDYGISSLTGHCLMKLKCTKEASTYYTRVMEMYDRPDDIHLIYLYAAICFDEQGDSQLARKLVLLACKHAPSPQTWLHAGGYYFKQNDLLSAEECLTQANLLDNRLPEIWGLLALVNSYLGRQHESDMCYVQAKKLHLNDEELLDKIEKSRTDAHQNIKQENT